MNKTQVRQEGYNRGYAAGDNVELISIGDYVDGHLICEHGKVKVTSSNWFDVHHNLAASCESDDRSFSPFEFLAHDINLMGDNPRIKYDVWDEFDSASNRGMVKALAKRYKASVLMTKDDYCKTFDGSLDLFNACWRKLRAYAKSSIDLDFNENLEVERWLSEIASELVNDSSSRFYIYG